MPHSGLYGAGDSSERPLDAPAIGPLPFLCLGVLDVDDVLRPRRRLAELERLGLRLDVPGIVRAALDPRPAEPDRARPRQPAELRRVPRAVDQDVEPVRPASQRVLLVVGQMDDAVAGPELVDLLVLPRQA